MTSADVRPAAIQKATPGQHRSTWSSSAAGSKVALKAKTGAAGGRTVLGVVLKVDFQFPFSVTIDAGNVGGPLGGADVLARDLRQGDHGRAHRRPEHRRHRHHRQLGQGRADRRASGRSWSAPVRAARATSWPPPTTATRSAARCPTASRRSGSPPSTTPGPRSSRSSPATRRASRPADPHTPCVAAQSSKVARRAATSPGARSEPVATASSASCARWRIRHTDVRRAARRRAAGRPGGRDAGPAPRPRRRGRSGGRARRPAARPPARRRTRSRRRPAARRSGPGSTRGSRTGAAPPARSPSARPGAWSATTAGCSSCGSRCTRVAVRTSAKSRGGWSQPAPATWRSVWSAAIESGSSTGRRGEVTGRILARGASAHPPRPVNAATIRQPDAVGREPGGGPVVGGYVCWPYPGQRAAGRHAGRLQTDRARL